MGEDPRLAAATLALLACSLRPLPAACSRWGSLGIVHVDTQLTNNPGMLLTACCRPQCLCDLVCCYPQEAPTAICSPLAPERHQVSPVHVVHHTTGPDRARVVHLQGVPIS